MAKNDSVEVIHKNTTINPRKYEKDINTEKSPTSI